MREYLTLHRSIFPSYLTVESGRMISTSLAELWLDGIEMSLTVVKL